MLWCSDDIGSRDRKTREHMRAFDQFAPLFAHHRIPCERTSDMEFGDFFFLGNGPDGPSTLTVGVERKTVKDMLASNRSNRFSDHQLPGLLSTYAVPYLIVEGAYRADPATGILEEWVGGRGGEWAPLKLGSSTFMHSELERFMLSVSIMTAHALGSPLHVYKTRTREETAQAIANLYVLLTAKEWGEHRSHLGVRMPVIPGPTLLRPRTREEKAVLTRRKIAMCLECGIGAEKSEAVAAHFHSHREMMNAGEKEWQEIDGIGKGIARKVVEEMTYASETHKGAT